VESGGWLWLFSDAGVSEHVARKKAKTTLLFFIEMMSAFFDRLWVAGASQRDAYSFFGI